METPWEVVLVTGGRGFLGQHIVKLLQEHDSAVKEVRVLDLEPYVNRLGHEERKPLHSFVGDIRNVEECRDAFCGVHCVIHCAALVSYQFPPDTAALHQTNIIGTKMVISLCQEYNVSRLVFCSTTEVTLVSYLKGTFSVIVNQTESKALAPDDEEALIFPGYPASKLGAERLVLAADCRELSNGRGHLRTIAIRPTLLYGEEDPRLVPALIRLAEANDGRLVMFAGPGGKQQVTYVGNAAWAHLRAKDVLLQRPTDVGGLAVFITDDTPVGDLLRFAQRITCSASAPPRCQLTRWYMPFLLAYLTAIVVELGAIALRLNMPVAPRAVVSYLGSIIFYNRLRAAIHLEYSPIFSVEECLRRSKKYYTSEDV